MERYVEEDQRHERVAMGIEMLPTYPRAGDRVEGSTWRLVRSRIIKRPGLRMEDDEDLEEVQRT